MELEFDVRSVDAESIERVVAAARAGLEEVADVTDAGMLFAPSRDGVSHIPWEWTNWTDCAAATRVFAGAVADLAGA